MKEKRMKHARKKIWQAGAIVRTEVRMGDVPAGTVAPVLRAIQSKRVRIVGSHYREYTELPARLELDVGGEKKWVYGDMVEEL